MAKVTSKLQVTVPKAIADKYHIRPGDEIEWVASGELIRIIPRTAGLKQDDRAIRLHLFDQATERQRQRDVKTRALRRRDRGWKREDLYNRGVSH